MNRTHCAEWLACSTHKRAEVEQRIVKGGVGSSSPCKLMKVKTKLPSRCLLASSDTSHDPLSVGVNDDRMPSEPERDHGVGNIVADPRETV